MSTSTSIRMTSLAACAGCAAKLSPEALSGLLGSFRSHQDPRLLVGLQTSDDAAIYQLSSDLAIVQTTDFFTPIVDDPWTFGAIAAANAMSDVYAMGGEVRFALNIAAFPADLPETVVSAILDGGAEKVREAGGVIAGGHTITTEEPIFGLSVTGEVHPDRVWTKAGAEPGDAVFLTKPIGVGVITTALKNQAMATATGEVAIASMLTLNRRASEFARNFPITACTDVTGYSLAGHALEVADRSGVRIEISAPDIPLFAAARHAVELGQVPGGLLRNEGYFRQQGVQIAAGVDSPLATLCFDPQTSGGMLLTIPNGAGAKFEAAAAEIGLPLWRIGRVTSGSGVDIIS